jgi:hypothetical protein
MSGLFIRDPYSHHANQIQNLKQPNAGRPAGRKLMGRHGAVVGVLCKLYCTVYSSLIRGVVYSWCTVYTPSRYLIYLKGLCHEMKKFLKAYYDKYVFNFCKCADSLKKI